MIPKHKPVRSEALRKAARGQPCTLRMPGVCNGDYGTTVLAHSPVANGGMGTKGSDLNGAFACSDCHDCVDRRAHTDVQMDLVHECWIRGHQETMEIWREQGLLTVKGDKS